MIQCTYHLLLRVKSQKGLHQADHRQRVTVPIAHVLEHLNCRFVLFARDLRTTSDSDAHV